MTKLKKRLQLANWFITLSSIHYLKLLVSIQGNNFVILSTKSIDQYQLPNKYGSENCALSLYAYVVAFRKFGHILHIMSQRSHVKSDSSLGNT